MTDLLITLRDGATLPAQVIKSDPDSDRFLVRTCDRKTCTIAIDEVESVEVIQCPSNSILWNSTQAIHNLHNALYRVLAWDTAY